jgi:hypothetical protein
VVLGSYVDPKFGSFDGSFYTQVRLAGVNPNFGSPSTIAVDSMVIALEYAGYYGDLSTQKFEVFALNEDLNNDSTYYAFSTKTYAPTSLVTPGKEYRRWRRQLAGSIAHLFGYQFGKTMDY